MAKSIYSNDTVAAEKIVSANLFVSDFYEIKHLGYNLTAHRESVRGHNNCLCMVYVKRGSFLLDYFTRSYNMPPGYILLDKPDCEYRIRPSDGACTVFNFTEDFYRQYAAATGLKDAFFFSNSNVLSVMLQSKPAIDYLHYQVLNKIPGAGKLEMDTLMLEFFNQVAGIITNTKEENAAAGLVNASTIAAMEAAKDYINSNFTKDISLQEIAASCFISAFHFSRLFKKITSFSPYKYLQQVRLKHAEMLLKNTAMPVTDIAYASGFNSTAYFATSFRQQYKTNPLQYRRQQ